jgi:hypothetical protein
VMKDYASRMAAVSADKAGPLKQVRNACTAADTQNWFCGTRSAKPRYFSFARPSMRRWSLCWTAMTSTAPSSVLSSDTRQTHEGVCTESQFSANHSLSEHPTEGSGPAKRYPHEH